MDISPLNQITVNKASQISILLLLEACDEDFIPKLSSCVDLNYYAKKLHSKAFNYEYWIGQKLIGLVSMYWDNNTNSSAFISNVCVLNNYSGKGVASKLLRSCILYAENNRIEEIKLEVSKVNNIIIMLYKKHGFSFLREDDINIIMELKIKN
jgi:ribosomal protein S18 acetylase RimI-like enzyme